MLKLPVNARIVCLGVAVVFISGCANKISLPEPPSEVRKVYLVDLGRHTRMAFELANGDFVEFGYGEWKWYANMESQWWRVPAVLFWPTQGTLGRRLWQGPDAERRFLAEYRGLIVHDVSAEESRVDALVAVLERAFNLQSGQLVHNPVYRLDFVPYDRSYWLFNNSNHAVKNWLQELGYEVRGTGVLAKWRYEEQPHS